MANNQTEPKLDFENPLKSFQLSGDIKDKTDKRFGEKIVTQCEQILNSSFFTERNARFALNRQLAEGRIDMNKFKDFFNINGKVNYTNISWKAIMVVNTIISRLVGRWMTKREKAKVEAVDPISTKKKKEVIEEAEFLLYNKEILQQLQEQSGEQMIPQDAFVPDDKDDLDLWAKEELRLPEEILLEKGINGVLDENGWSANGINTRKVKHDSATVGLICAEKYADKDGKIHVDYHKPENSFSSYTEFEDFRDADLKGVIVSYTLSEIRDLYPKLTTEELYKIATVSKQFQYNNKLTYDSRWVGSRYLPFDDWTVDCVKFTLKSLDNDRSLIKTARDGSLYIDKPKKRIEDVYEGNEYIEKKIWNIYYGVYVRTTKQLLEWDLDKNMCRPQSYDKIGEVYSRFSFYMYQNQAMRNLAVPEKIEEPVEQMILARLKIQQLVAGMRKSGLQYDIDGLQEMDLGNGIVKPLELMKITDQSGNVYYRSKDAEGNRIESPVKELPNTGSVPQIQALIQVYNFHQQVLRDEIGSNEQAEGQTAKPRVGQENVATSLEISFNAIDYMNDACISLTQELASHIACLLHDSVRFGAEEYRSLMKEEDVKERVFNTKIEMLPDTQEITELSVTINNAINANPDLVMYLNPEKIKRIAQENVKLGEEYFRMGQKRALKGRMAMKEQDSKMNAQIQAEAGISVEKEKQNTAKAEMESKTQIEMALSAARQKEVILNGIFSIYSKGVAMPKELQELAKEVVVNVGIPLFAQNMQMQQQMEQSPEEENAEAGTEQNQQEEMQEQ